MPSDELEPGAARVLDAVRSDPRLIELPRRTNDASRRRIDVQLDLYGGLRDGRGDEARADGLMAPAAARSRSLLEEVAEFEYAVLAASVLAVGTAAPAGRFCSLITTLS